MPNEQNINFLYKLSKKAKKRSKSVPNLKIISNMTNCRKISLLITNSEDTSLEGGNMIYTVFSLVRKLQSLLKCAELTRVNSQ